MLSRLADGRSYLDANVFIYAVEGYAKYESLARELASYVDAGRLGAVTSELTLAEVLVNPLKQGRSSLVLSFETALRSRGTFEVVPISRDVLRRSAEVRANYGGKLADSIRCATALQTQCKYLLTADRAFKVPKDLALVLLDDLLPN